MAASQRPGPVEELSVAGRRLTHARAYAQSLEHPALETVEERVNYIAGLMAEQVWDDETSKELQLLLARKWDLSTDSSGCPAVRHYSAEASRSLHGRAREDAGRYATTALQSLAYVAQHAKFSDLPGDKNAAVNAADKLLRYAGLAEPEEDKSRPTTLIQVGQVVASPVFSGLLNGSAKKLNGKAENGTASNGHAEDADVVPNGSRRKPVV